MLEETIFTGKEWHDNKLHSISVEVEDFSSQLILDIDYIDEWPKNAGEEFKILPTSIVFDDVTDLYIGINWGDSGYLSAKDNLFIVDVVRERVETPMKIDSYYKWEIIFSDRNSKIMFGSSGYTQISKSNLISSQEQFLKAAQRK